MCYFCRRHLIFVALLLSISWLLCTCFMTVIFSSLLLVALVISLDGLTSPFYVLLLTSCDKSFTPVMLSIHVAWKCDFLVIVIFPELSDPRWYVSLKAFLWCAIWFDFLLIGIWYLLSSILHSRVFVMVFYINCSFF